MTLGQCQPSLRQDQGGLCVGMPLAGEPGKMPLQLQADPFGFVRTAQPQQELHLAAHGVSIDTLVAGREQTAQPFVELRQPLLGGAGEEARLGHDQLAATEQFHRRRDIPPDRRQR